jgi:hypothetical protein
MVHRTMKTKRQSSLFEPNGVGNHRVARRGANSFADAVGKPDREHLLPVTGKREQRPHQCRQRVSANNQEFPSPQSIAKVTGKQFEQTRDRFSQSFDYADRSG